MGKKIAEIKWATILRFDSLAPVWPAGRASYTARDYLWAVHRTPPRSFLPNLRRVTIKCLCLLAILLFSGRGLLFAQAGTIPEGSWQGTFMESFQLTLDFRKGAAGDYSGAILLFQDGNQLQNDPLADIRVEGDSLHFFIPAKGTPFTGYINSTEQSITGYFTFPDGARHPVFLKRAIASEQYRAGEPLDKEKLRTDLAFLFSAIRDHHPAPYRYLSEEGFLGLYQETVAEVEKAGSIEQFILLASRLTDAVGCSHTGLRPPEQQEEKVWLPIQLHYANGKLWCISGAGEGAGLPPGSEVLSINGQPSVKIVEALFSLIPAEGWNSTTKPALLNKEFENYYAMLDPAGSFEVLYRLPKSKTVQSRILPAAGRAAIEAGWKTETPGGQHSPGLPLSFYREETSGTAVLRLPTFGVPNLEAYLETIQDIFGQLQRDNTPNLILDLHGNEGGHPIFAAILFSYLTDEVFTWFDDDAGVVESLEPLYNPMEPAVSSFKGRLFVLVDGACLSTTGHLIAHLQASGRGIMVGEQPGSFATCYDNSIRLTLPYSGLQANIARSTFTIALPEGQEPGKPVVDHEISPAVEDILEGRDAVLQACYRLARGQE